MRTRIVTPPSVEPITLDEAKHHLNVTHDEDDAFIASIIAAARSTVETGTHRALLTQVWDITLPAWPADGAIRLPGGQCQSVDSVTYIDAEGVEQTLASEEYQADVASDQGGILLPPLDGAWPALQSNRISPVTIRATLGWATPGDIPEMLVHGVRFVLGHYYENREAVVTGTTSTALPLGAESIMRTFSVWGVM